MVTKGNILGHLKRLNALYSKPSKAGDELYFAKLAVIEVGGWVEQTMDEIILSLIKTKVSGANQTYIENDVVKKTYGFDYHSNFRSMLIRGIGIVGVEKLESKVNAAKFLQLKSELGSLKASRDSLAHTHISGAATTIDAPSTSILRCERIYEGLLDLERTLRAL